MAKKSKISNPSLRQAQGDKSKIVIGSRGSELALWQANFILKELEAIGVKAKINIINTQGDKIQDIGFDKMEGKGFFTKELEEALLTKEIDIAVHSHKDLPTVSPKGLTIAAVSYRENPADVILVNKNAVEGRQKFSIKQNAKLGTSSARRKSQLLSFRPDIKIEDLRGNLPTRIQKLREGKYDAIILAAAGIERLEIDLKEFYVEKLSCKEFIPAPAQGVIALQTRESDKELIKSLQKIHHPDVAELIDIERKVLNLFDGGCQLPLGVYCEKEDDKEGNTIYKAWVAKAEAWNKVPKYFYIESRKPETFADKIVTRMNGIKPCTVFISRNLKPHDFFQRTLEAAKYKVTASALIETQQIEIKRTPKTEWIFFSSKNAVKHFFEQNPQLEAGVRYAAVGKATSDELRKFGKRAEFIGDANNTIMTGKKFGALANRGRILFPQAKGSIKTIQQQLKKEQVIDLLVYETLQAEENKQLKPEKFDVLVFTSPSNVEAFYEKYKINGKQQVIAMGDATANALRQLGKISPQGMPATFDDMGLVQAVFSL